MNNTNSIHCDECHGEDVECASCKVSKEMPTDRDRLRELREFVEKRFAAMKQTCPSTPEDEHALGCTLILAEIDRLLCEPDEEYRSPYYCEKCGAMKLHSRVNGLKCTRCDR